MAFYHEKGERGNGQNIFNMYRKQKRNCNIIVTKINMFPSYQFLLFKKAISQQESPSLHVCALAEKGQQPTIKTHLAISCFPKPWTVSSRCLFLN